MAALLPRAKMGPRRPLTFWPTVRRDVWTLSAASAAGVPLRRVAVIRVSDQDNRFGYGGVDYILTVVTCSVTMVLTLPTEDRASSKAGRPGRSLMGRSPTGRSPTGRSTGRPPRAGAAIAEPMERAARARVENCMVAVVVVV